MIKKSKIEISEEEFFHFLKCWISSKKINLNIEQIFELHELVSNCFEDKMMFDSWFRGIDVMN